MYNIFIINTLDLTYFFVSNSIKHGTERLVSGNHAPRARIELKPKRNVMSPDR